MNKILEDKNDIVLAGTLYVDNKANVILSVLLSSFTIPIMKHKNCDEVHGKPINLDIDYVLAVFLCSLLQAATYKFGSW